MVESNTPPLKSDPTALTTDALQREVEDWKAWRAEDLARAKETAQRLEREVKATAMQLDKEVEQTAVRLEKQVEQTAARLEQAVTLALEAVDATLSLIHI